MGVPGMTPHAEANCERLDEAAHEVVHQALREALQRGDSWVGPEHLALAIRRMGYLDEASGPSRR